MQSPQSEENRTEFWKTVTTNVKLHHQAPPIKPVSRKEKLLLSFSQERLWWLEQLQPGSSIHNMRAAYRLQGSLNVAVLEKSLKEIVLRHEILRTTFPSVDGQPVQSISEEIDLKLSVVDLREISEPEREAEAQRLAIKEAEQPFDLNQKPLMRLKLLRLADEEYWWLRTVHHIIFDGWSYRVFMRELAVLYEAFSTGNPSPLPELAIQYADFAQSQRQCLQGKVLESQINYWKQQLGGRVSPLELPIDYPRPTVPTYRGASQSLILSKKLTEKLKALSYQEGVSLFVILLAAFKTLLHGYTGQKDIILCSPIAGRNKAEIKRLIGYFNNIVVMRTDLSGSPSFRELIRRVSRVTLGAYEHQEMPFEKLTDFLNLVHTTLYRGMFALQNTPPQPKRLAGIVVSHLEISSEVVNFDFFLSMTEEGGQLKGVLQYKTDLFKTVTITQMLDHFQTLLEDLAANPAQSLTDLPLLTETKCRQLNNKTDDRYITHSLPKLIQSSFRLKTSFVPPRTPTEEILSTIWTNIFGVEIGIHDNFFELGGNSLIATQLISRIRDAFAVEWPVRHLFVSPTIATISEYIEAARFQNCIQPKTSIQPVSRSGEISLSFAQQRLWFLDQLEKPSTTYNCLTAVRLVGSLHVAALKKAINEIVKRHEALRTTFPSVNGFPIQVIASTSIVALPIVDLQGLSEEQQSKEVQCLAIREAQRPFNLANELLVRVTLLRLKENSHVLLLTIHHIVTDGWSGSIFWHELSVLYKAFSSGQPSPLADLPIQYADFAVWQCQWLKGKTLETQIAYWKKQLTGLSPVLELPTDRPRPTIETFRGAKQSFQLTRELTQHLKALNYSSKTTLFMTLLTAFAILLSRYSQQEDLAIGTPIANRTHSEIESLIGFFANTLVMRIDLQGNPSFTDLLVRVRQVALDAYAHQDLPFEKLVEELNPERHLSHHPLFQVLFALQNPLDTILEMPGLTILPEEVDSVTAKFDLTLSMMETKQGLKGYIEYNTDLFDVATITRIVEHFQTLLEGIVANPEQRLSDLALLTTAERHQLLVELNNTQTDYPKNTCIHQLFEAQAKRTPDAVAVIFENLQLTYQQLNHRANQLAHYLISLGVKPETLIGICVERSLNLIVALLAILKAGAAYVPLDPAYPQERLAYMLSDAQLSLLLTQEKLLNQLPNYQAQVICLDSDWEVISKECEHNPLSDVKPNNLAYIIYTSGSTGKPKGVLLAHQGLCNLALAQIQIFDVRPLSRVLQFASLSFDASVSEVFMALCAGATLCLARSDSLLPSENLMMLLRNQFITHVTLPPSVLAILPTEELPALQTIIVAGEACSADLVVKWSQGRRFFNAYGPTESTVCATVAECTDESKKTVIGRPIANIQIYILDTHLQPVPIGVLGELYIGGDGLARGYLNRPELSEEKFILNPFNNSKSKIQNPKLYKTGDLARYLPDGNIEFLGRIDNQVKIRGFRIELGEIEAAIAQHPSVQQTVVTASEDNPGDKRLVAYIVPHPEQALTTDELRRFLKQKLPDYMVPSAFVFLDALPLTPNGKIDRRALPLPNSSRPDLEETFVAPCTLTEQQIADIWIQLLKLEQIGIHDNFFALGGHSLLATQVISRLRQGFGIELPLQTLFEAPTVGELSSRIETIRWASQQLQAPANDTKNDYVEGEL